MMAKLTQLWHHLDRLHQRKVVLILLLTLTGAFLEMVGLGLIYPILNFVVSGEMPDILTEFLSTYGLNDKDQMAVYAVIFFAGFFLFKNLILTYWTYHLNRLLSEVRCSISSRLFRGYIESDYAFFISNSSSEITKNLTSLVVNFNAFVLNPFGVLLTEGFVLLALVGLALAIKPIDSLILFTLILVPSLLYFKLTRIKVRGYGLVAQQNEALRIKTTNEMVGGIRDIRLLDKGSYFNDQFNTFDSLVATANFKNSFISQSSKYFLECVLILAIAVLVFTQSLAGNAFVSLIPALGFYALAGFRVIPSINRLINALQALKFGEAILDTVNQEFKRHEKIIPSAHANSSLQSFEESIRIEGVAFRYQPRLPYIFKNLNLGIKKGDSVGICGETGAGKSSFLNLVLGFLIPTTGTIKIDGHDIHQNKMALKHVLGYVPQDIFLLDDSIANNVAFGEVAGTLDRKRVRWALNEAQMEGFITKQKMGINTHVGERGVRLSGGQKQRLGIARALYFGAKILVFDEATSALDEATERAVMHNIAKLKNKYTLIVVAHRLSTLKVCDRIYTLGGGSLVATELD
jgi:ATP-binding cassette, subfamily B, bacterial PglK